MWLNGDQHVVENAAARVAEALVVAEDASSGAAWPCSRPIVGNCCDGPAPLR